MALYTGGGRRRIAAAARVRRRACCGTCCATAAATTSCTPRSFPYFSLLAAARCAAARALRARRRLARGLERATTGASTSGAPGARRVRSCSASARGCRSARSASRELHARAPARGGPARRGDGAARASTRARSRRAERRARREPLVRVRRPPDPGEAGAGGRRGVALAARRGSRACAATFFGDGPEREARAGGDRRARPAGASSRAPGFVDSRRRSTRRCGAATVHAAALAPRGLRPGRRRGGRAGHAERRGGGPGQRRDRADRGGRQRHRGRGSADPTRSPRRSCASTTPAARCARARAAWFAGQRAAAVARVARCRRCSTATRGPARSE